MKNTGNNESTTSSKSGALAALSGILTILAILFSSNLGALKYLFLGVSILLASVALFYSIKSKTWPAA
jgi:hypothetical protein